MISLARFRELVTQGNFIPIYTELMADLETPVAAWYRVCQQAQHSFLLESVEGGETLGRYSFLGCNPLWTLTVRGDHTLQAFRGGRHLHHSGDPFAVLADCLAPYQPVHLPELPQSIGGLVGYWGYDLMRWIEPTVPVGAAKAGEPPDAVLMQMDSILVFDQVKRKIFVIVYADTRELTVDAAYAEASQRLEALAKQVTAPLDTAPLALNWLPPPRPPVAFQASVSAPEFQAAVETAQAHIRAGDIFQVVLSQRLTATYKGDPFLLYRALRVVNPSPYMAFIQCGELQLIGSSPEVMVRLDREADQAIATVRPIAGTRPRGDTPAADAAYAEELLADPKERAEHVMLVDLGRNDLGRVCERGTVNVDELMVIERYSHVMHIVSNVTGQLRPECSAWDLLKATFPAGTVSGAPKIRAMQILHDLENLRRGPYAGAYGYYDFRGQLNTAITLRTLWVQNGQVTIQAGAGIVADSVPELEYQETLNKAKGMLEAIALVQAGQA